jgi:prenyltransferase beta subunit
MIKRVFALLLTWGLVLTIALPVLAQEDVDTSLQQAVEFLETAQNQDGGFTNGFAPESDVSTTADAVVALAAAEQDLSTITLKGGADPLTYLSDQVEAGNVTQVGQLAKILTAAMAAGEDPTSFGGHDLVADILVAQFEGGVFGFGMFDHCLTVIALQNAGTKLPAHTVDVLLENQAEDGGWGFMEGQASDTNTTALCLQALAPIGEDKAVEAGLNYLESIQNEDGGWPYQNPSEYGTDSDSNSTALVIQALIANGEDLADWNNPQEWLAGMQLEDGSFMFQEAAPAASILSTVAAIPALEGIPLNAWAPVPEVAG